MVGRKIFHWLFIAFLCTIYSCSSDIENGVIKNSGGTFKYCESNRINTLHPPLVSDQSSKRIASQVFESLVKLSPIDLEVQASLAEKFTFDPDNFTYTFNIKKGVFFHDNPCFKNGKGRELTANDVVFTFKQLCTKQLINSSYYNVLKGVVKGADAYFNGDSDQISGIKTIDPYTVEIQLKKPNSSFLKKLAGINFSIIAKEAINKYGLKNNVGTGPFIPQPFDSYNDHYILTKNTAYHKKDKAGNQLPYLDSIIVVFDLGIKQQMKEVVEGNHSAALNLPVKAVKRVLREHNNLFDSVITMQNSALLSTCYIEMNLNSKKLANKSFRKALSYAINKSLLTQMVFGETRGKVGDIGITHPSIIEYRTGRIKGYTYNLDSARKFMKEANLGENISLELEIGENDYKSQSIADEIRLQLEQSIDVQLKINIVPERYKLEKSRYARGDLAISNIVSEYVSPDGFLNMFYGKGIPSTIDIPSYPNTTRFKNRAFDKMMDRGRKSVDTENAYRSFASAERLLMEEAPIIVLWYEEANRLVNSNIQNFPLNKLQYLDLSEVYYKN